jgi:PAS domain S-box-containing protein
MADVKSQTVSSVELRLQSILETALDAYVSMNARGRVIHWNRQAEATFGFSRDEVLGNVLAETIIPPRYRDAHARGLKHFLRTGEGRVLNTRLQIQALHRDGHEFPVELTIWPLREGDAWTFHAFIRDATDLREAQKRALQSERQAAVAEIMSVLTDDSSNALQQMQMGIDLLALKCRGDAATAEHIERMQKARDRLECLLKDVHGCAIPLRLTRRDWNLADIWREAWAQLDAQRQARNIELVQDTGPTDLCCAVDWTGMEQVFRILFQNSLTRCADPVRIEIGCADDSMGGGPALRITVRDNGPALPPEQWVQVFEIVDFRRLHEPGTQLLIAARIVDAHGGRMTTSGHYQQGAEVFITLPRSAA